MFFENRSDCDKPECDKPGNDKPNNDTCAEYQGRLPECGNLVFPYVPLQRDNPSTYEANEALNTGTLFPSLNLPFHLKVNASNVVKGPLNELQALEFVIQELGLYLDTHPNDKEAFALYQKYVGLEKTARKNFVASNGPLFQTDAAKNDKYNWLQDPWPWNKTEEGGK